MNEGERRWRQWNDKTLSDQVETHPFYNQRRDKMTEIMRHAGRVIMEHNDEDELHMDGFEYGAVVIHLDPDDVDNYIELDPQHVKTLHSWLGVYLQELEQVHGERVSNA